MPLILLVQIDGGLHDVDVAGRVQPVTQSRFLAFA